MRAPVIGLLSLSLLAGCASAPRVQHTQLELRQFQTREYATTDSRMVLKAVLNVLQDDGFMVEQASPELGLLSASKEVDIEKRGQAIAAALFAGVNARWNKTRLVEATANVSEFGERCRVRVTFESKVTNNKGEVVSVDQIGDEAFYQEFFAKVDKGIFIQQEGL